MKKLISVCMLLCLAPVYAQVSLLKTHQMDYPISRIVHYEHCGDSPLYVCKKSEDVFLVINGNAKVELSANESLLAADKTHIYTTIYTTDQIILKRYEIDGNGYKKIKEMTFARSVNNMSYYIDVEMVDDHLYYFAYQPNTSSTLRPASIDFYNQDINKVFSIQEDLSVYNIHCFGADSVLVLKEYVYDKKLTTHLYDHTGKLLKEESFMLEFKPGTQSTVSDYLKDDGVIFALEQTEKTSTHVIKYTHAGKLLWDEVLNDHYYGFTEYKNMLVAYGGGNFYEPAYKMLFVDETKGVLAEEIELGKYYQDFLEHKKLSAKDHSYIPFALNVNPEHTWVCFVMSIYTTVGKSADADRIIIYYDHNKVQTLDIELAAGEHPKIVPTDKNHLIVAIGKTIYIYKVS